MKLSTLEKVVRLLHQLSEVPMNEKMLLPSAKSIFGGTNNMKKKDTFGSFDIGNLAWACMIGDRAMTILTPVLW